MPTYTSSSPAQQHTLIYVVDDDEAVRDSLKWVLEATNYQVLCFSDAEAFLEAYNPDQVACLILDVRMPGMSGLELQEHLGAQGSDLPILFITGHGDVSMAVETMKKGAADFIEKPFNQAELHNAVGRMIQKARDNANLKQLRRDRNSILAKITPREQQVLDRVIAGRLNKQIADDLKISIKTVEAHRANIMYKLGVHTFADLLRLVLDK